MGTVTATEPAFSDLTVYPNPAQTTLTVTFGRLPAPNTELELINLTGQSIIWRQVNSVKEVISVANLPAGQYSLRIKNEIGIQTKKVVIP
ncbi:MAG: T9SS type A sorting domain-containing protein [Cytophagaceae bacterium]|nr:MAG: T9SS type A sorting domain-containing protein [Cytophagaceae bacterium]